MTLTVRQRLAIAARSRARDVFWEELDHDRESYVCPRCGYEAQGKTREFDVHHRDGDWLNNHPLNLVALCRPCHHLVHRWLRRPAQLDEWKEGFLALGESHKPPTDSQISSRGETA